MNESSTMTGDQAAAVNADFRSSRWKFRIVVAAMTVASVLCGSAATSWSAPLGGRAASPSAPVQVADPAAPRMTSPPSSPDLAAMEDAYASREASAKNLENFRGGDVVIIGSTGLILVLLIIVILIAI